MESTFSSRRLRRFLPRAGTQLAQKQEELERNLREAVALAEEGEDGGEEEEILDTGDGVDGGNEQPKEVDEQVDTRAESERDEEEEENMVVGNDLVEKVAAEVEGSRTRRGHRYDGGGHL